MGLAPVPVGFFSAALPSRNGGITVLRFRHVDFGSVLSI
jgi:hypothetical protein